MLYLIQIKVPGTFAVILNAKLNARMEFDTAAKPMLTTAAGKSIDQSTAAGLALRRAGFGQFTGAPPAIPRWPW
jgi:hypothetical protein